MYGATFFPNYSHEHFNNQGILGYAEVCYLVYYLSENALDKSGNFSFIHLFGVSQLSSAGTRKVIADTI